MTFRVQVTHALPLDGQTQWVWYALDQRAFIVGDQQQSWRVPEGGETPEPLARGGHGLTLPLPDALLDARLTDGWCGFGFPARDVLEAAARSDAPHAGDLLRHVVFGPDYGQLVTHPAMPPGRALSLRSGTMRLLSLEVQESVQGVGVVERSAPREIATVRTRGNATLAYAAHPSEPIVVYGDNAGDTFMQRLSGTGFGKTTAIARHGRKVSAMRFTDDGKTLLVGGLGYLAQYAWDGARFASTGSMATAVRELIPLGDERRLLVNRGLHGLALVTCARERLELTDQWSSDEAVQQVAIDPEGRRAALLHQGSGRVTLLELPAG